MKRWQSPGDAYAYCRAPGKYITREGFIDRKLPAVFGGQVCGRQTKGIQAGGQGSRPRAC